MTSVFGNSVWSTIKIARVLVILIPSPFLGATLAFEVFFPSLITPRLVVSGGVRPVAWSDGGLACSPVSRHPTPSGALLIKWRVEVGKRMDIYRYMKQCFGDTAAWKPRY